MTNFTLEATKEWVRTAPWNGFIVPDITSNCQLASFGALVDYVYNYTHTDYDDDDDETITSTIMETYYENYNEHYNFFKQVRNASKKPLMLFDVNTDDGYETDTFLRKFFEGYIVLDAPYTSSNRSPMNIFIINLTKFFTNVNPK